MSLPRQIRAGLFYMVTRRCAQRQLLMRPDPEINNIFTYCLAVAAVKCQIDVILPSALSNHHHTIIFDRYGRVVEFIHRFHLMVAKALNEYFGRSENLWSAEPPSLVVLVDREAVIEKLVYAATNPVKDGLVEQVHHWPGVNGLNALLNGRVLEARRPRYFFGKTGNMPNTIELRLTIPPELGNPAEVRQAVRERVDTAVERFAIERRQSGKRVLGRRNVLHQSHRSIPTGGATRGGLRPRFAAHDRGLLHAALREYRAFLATYADARAAWLAGLPVSFPVGTYWLRRFANVPVVGIEPARHGGPTTSVLAAGGG